MFDRCSWDPPHRSGKAASAYFAYYFDSGLRVAHRLRYCPGHVDQLLAHLELAHKSEAAAAEGGSPTCAGCGADTSDDLAYTFSTFYLPQREREDYVIYTCNSCAVTFRGETDARGARLSDRPDNGRPRAGARNDPWAGLIPGPSNSI